MRIHKVMSEVKLHPVEDFLKKFPHMLSGGQQRIVIARAMLCEPKLIVADDPVSMLDASVRVEILKLMRALQESHGLSVIYNTHDLSCLARRDLRHRHAQRRNIQGSTARRAA
ncbi:MAG: ABC transporter ATP-binding protein [Anaerolineales bacterium]